jgi:hypothetical protein
MSKLRIAATLLALVAILAATQFGAAGDKNETYTLVIKKVEVKTTQKNGNSWDVNDGKPDLRVIIRNTSDKSKDAKAYESKSKEDVFSHDFNEPTNIKFTKGQTLEFEVVDVDVAVNDTVGKTAIEMKDDRLREGKMRIETFDQVVYLEVELKKL